MQSILNATAHNLLSPMILCFLLGAFAAAVRSDLLIPESIAKALSLYLMFAIGFKGGASLAVSGADARTAGLAAAGVLMSFFLPFVAFALLRLATRLGAVGSAAVAAHYGSISVVTFVTAVGFLDQRAEPYDGAMVAVMALMETRRSSPRCCSRR